MGIERKYLSSILILTTFLNGGVSHEQPPFFVKNFPVVLELNFSKDDDIKDAFLSLIKNGKTTNLKMICSSSNCRVAFPTGEDDNLIEYRLSANFCGGRELKTPIISIKSIPLPNWQLSDNFQFITIKSSEKLKGFSENNILVRNSNENIVQEIVKNEISEDKSEDKSFWSLFNPLNWFSNSSSSSEEIVKTSENDIEENENKKEIVENRENLSSSKLREVQTP
jgi:hypothetical protein